MSVIKDKLLEPYYIEVLDNSFTLYEDTGKLKDVKNKSKEVIGQEAITNVVGYYSNLGSTLYKIAKLQVANQQEVFTLLEYIDSYENISKKLLSAINE